MAILFALAFLSKDVSAWQASTDSGPKNKHKKICITDFLLYST